MQIDHIFLISTTKGSEADKLVEFGLIEGSNRVHLGQGTTNRKFYFDNFFLELVWVIDKAEIQSEVTSVSKLWERTQFHYNRYSRFGLCLENSEITNKLFEKCEHYFPIYLPKGTSIEFISNDECPQLPWTFRSPFKPGNKVNNEPKDHPNRIKSLTKAIFELNAMDIDRKFVSQFDDTENIKFVHSSRTYLNLEFDRKVQQKEMIFPKLNLTIRY